MMTPPEVLAAWAELTGQSWRLIPYEVQEQATTFSQAGFSRDEMLTVLAFTRREIARGTSGFNALSLTWRVLAADRWAKFQERLSLAQEAARRARPVREVAVSRKLPDGRTESVFAPEPEREADPMDVEAAMAELKRKLARQ